LAADNQSRGFAAKIIAPSPSERAVKPVVSVSNPVDGFSTRYLYACGEPAESNGPQVIAEYDGNNNLLRKYIYGPGIDQPVCMVEVADSNEPYYYHYDGLGSVVALSDSSGDTVQTYQYSVFGQVAVEDINHPNPYMFAGRRFDIEIGLYYNLARYYNPFMGRFLQTNPIGYGDGINWYLYCGNSPLNFVDPWGQRAWWACAVELTGEICGWIVDNYGPYASSVSDIATGVLYVVGSYHLACMGAGGTALGAFDTGITMMSVGVINIFATASGNPTFPESTVPTLTATYLFGEDVADYVSLAENLVLGRYVFWVREKKNADTLEITYEILQLIDGIWEIVTESDDPYLLDPYAGGLIPGVGSLVGVAVVSVDMARPEPGRSRENGGRRRVDNMSIKEVISCTIARNKSISSWRRIIEKLDSSL